MKTISKKVKVKKAETKKAVNPFSKFKAVKMNRNKFAAILKADNYLTKGTAKAIREEYERKNPEERHNKMKAFLAYEKANPLKVGQKVIFEDIDGLSQGTKKEGTLGASPLEIRFINEEVAFDKGLKIVPNKAEMCYQIPSKKNGFKKGLVSKKFRSGYVVAVKK